MVVSSVEDRQEVLVSRERFFAYLIKCGPFGSQGEAARATHAVLFALADTLSEPDARRIAAELPEWLGAELQSRSREAHGETELVDLVASVEEVPMGFAREHTAVVLQGLWPELSSDGKKYLRRVLPSEVADSLPPRANAQPPARALVRRADSTFASGRPGSRHPLSESRPTRAHRQSIAQTADPHSETKLSESHGTTQERLEETLASGRPKTG